MTLTTRLRTSARILVATAAHGLAAGGLATG